MKNQFQLGIWDIDGTLADSLAPTIEAFHEELGAHLKRPILEAEIAAYYGLSELRMVENMVGLEHAPAVYAAIRDNMQNRMRAIQPYPGVTQALQHLKDSGLKLAIFTGRGREGAEFLVETLKLRPLFDAIVTSDDVQNSKPHPEGVLMACSLLKVRPAEAFMIGDSYMDVEAALRAGAFGIGCTWDARSTSAKAVGHEKSHLVSTAEEFLAWFKSQHS